MESLQLTIESLTKTPHKAALYRQDTHFREGWEEFRSIVDYFDRISLLLLKPDAVVSGRMTTLLERVTHHGFTPVHVQKVRIDRLMFRSLWWYQHNAVTLDRLAVMTRLIRATPSVFLILRDDRYSKRNQQAVPASVRLTSLKNELRSELKAPNSFFLFVHTPDEPIDLIREMTILLDEVQRRHLVGLLPTAIEDPAWNVQDAVRALILDMESQYPCHDLNLEISRNRLQALGISLDQPLRQMLHIADSAEQHIKWDLILLTSQSVPSRLPDAVELVMKSSLQDWGFCTEESQSC